MKTAVTLAIAALSSCAGAGVAFAPAAYAGSGALRLLPGGIVYPEFNSEGLGNPGTLNGQDASVVRVLGEGNFFGSSIQSAGIDYAYSREKWGIDLGYDAYRYVVTGGGPTALTHRAHGAAGVRLEGLGVGLSYLRTILGDAAGQAELDLGIAYTMGKGRVALLIERLDSAPAAVIGFGAQHDDSYAIEYNLALPSFQVGLTAPGASYLSTLATSVYLGALGIGYQTYYLYTRTDGAGGDEPSFIDTPLGFSHAFALLCRVSRTAGMSLRFSTTNSLTLGVTFGL